MPADTIAKHYATLSPAERFALTIEAMARGDETDADRLEDTCPVFTYRAEDAAFRDRMRRAHVLALHLCLQMRGPLAQLRMAAAFREKSGSFAEGVVGTVQAAFLAGRAYGRREAGEDVPDAVPDRDAIAAEVAADTGLRGKLEEAREVAVEAVEGVAEMLVRSTASLHAAELLSQWEGFGRFCVANLDVEACTLMAALGMRDVDPTAEVLACCAGVMVGEKRVREWAGFWAMRWERRFGYAAAASQ